MDNGNLKLWDKNNFLGIGSFFLLTGALYMGALYMGANKQAYEDVNNNDYQKKISTFLKSIVNSLLKN